MKLTKYIWLALVGMPLLFSSCLKHGLNDNLPKFKDAFITDVFMEYRFEDPAATSGGSPVVRIVNLQLTGKQFKKREDHAGAATDSVVFTVTVPAASGAFSTEQRAKVTTGNLVFFSNISTAATMEAVENAPKPGAPGDFSQPRKYKITAADGNARIWTVRIAGFNK